MRLVVDSNILFTYFWKESMARKAFQRVGIAYYSPEFSLGELHKYRKDIMVKAGLVEGEFIHEVGELANAVIFVGREDYKEYMEKAARISPDNADCDFIALALKLKCPLWTRDQKLRKQHSVKITDTSDIIALIW